MTTAQIAQLGRADIAYYDYPSTEATEPLKTILLIHGFASSAQVNWVGTGWVKRLSEAGYRVIAIDNRGHGRSSKFYSADDYGPDIFAADALALLDHLEIDQCDIMGYSMGARITCWISHQAPQRVRRAVYGGMGSRIFGGSGGHELIAAGLETDDPSSIADPTAMAFRKFADATRSDRLALAACIRPAREKITKEMVAAIKVPTLVAVGSIDDIGGSPEELVAMMPNAEAVVLEGLDHMKATGAESYKQAAIEFLDKK
ncbi:MAG: alpha/beta hydrolase [Rhizobiaceae bacterium]|nr:alpha/beta hydrolase [Hyphomicrobiales bacterium]NRB31235.1 alpha/beta hydrolase [Rhizobiaceae bacterium]